MASDVREKAQRIMDPMAKAGQPVSLMLDALEYHGIRLTAAASGPVEQRVIDAIRASKRRWREDGEGEWMMYLPDVEKAVRAALAPASEEGA